MTGDIRVSIDFLGHRKRKKLQRILGKGAVLSLVDLWLSVAGQRPNGVLSGYTEEDIELDADWDGEPGKFVEALIDVGFLIKNDAGVYELYAWEEHQGWVAKTDERKDGARFNKLAQVNKRLHEALKEKGIKAISKDDYELVSSGKVKTLNDFKMFCGPLPMPGEPLANGQRNFAPAPAPSPSPSPAPTHIKKPPAAGSVPVGPAAPSVVSFKNSSKHFRSRLERIMSQVKDACENIQGLPEKKKPFNPFQAVQKAVNEGKHPDAILYALGVMAEEWASIGEPWGYWRGILDKNSRNLWEKENTQQAEGYKLAIADLLARSPDLFAAIGLTVKSIPGSASSRSSPGMIGG